MSKPKAGWHVRFSATRFRICPIWQEFGGVDCLEVLPLGAGTLLLARHSRKLLFLAVNAGRTHTMADRLEDFLRVKFCVFHRFPRPYVSQTTAIELSPSS